VAQYSFGADSLILARVRQVIQDDEIEAIELRKRGCGLFAFSTDSYAKNLL
jgi:hypothetical protein